MSAENAKDRTLADKLDPLIKQYAGLFKSGLRTPAMRKPSDNGMHFGENILTYDLRNCGRSGEANGVAWAVNRPSLPWRSAQ